jgi:sulfur relay (sulfurtransferase) DsrC/TusE family protein
MSGARRIVILGGGTGGTLAARIAGIPKPRGCI